MPRRVQACAVRYNACLCLCLLSCALQELIRRQAEIKEARRVMDVEGGVDDVPEQ